MSNSTQSKEKQNLISLITLGTVSTGKTCLSKRFTNNDFEPDKYIATIGVDFFSKKVILEGQKEYKIKIFDTAGQERFKSITSQLLSKVQGVAFIYDVTDRNTFNKVEEWVKFLSDKVDTSHIASVLLGNKTDLNDKRVVSEEDGKQLARKMGMEYFDVSALNGINVQESFTSWIMKVIEITNQEEEKKMAEQKRMNEWMGVKDEYDVIKGDCVGNVKDWEEERPSFVINKEHAKTKKNEKNGCHC